MTDRPWGSGVERHRRRKRVRGDVPGIVSDTWNTGFASPSFVFSLGNTKATNGTGSAGDIQVRSVHSQSGGLFFASFVLNQPNGGSETLACGFATAAHSFNSYLGQDTESVGFWADGTVWLNSVKIGNYPHLGVNASNTDFLIGLAYNRITNELWVKNFTRGGDWNETIGASPVADLGGLPLTGLSSNPLFLCTDNELQFESTTIDGSLLPPAGYSSWLGAQTNPWYAWGDSLTAGNEDNTGVTFPGVLQTSQNRPVINEGVGGNTSSQILTRFQALPSSWGRGTIIWSGRNNSSNPSQVESDIATMVATLTTGNYLVLSVTNSELDQKGSGAYNNIISINTALTAAYGSKYLDIRSKLVAAYNPSIGPDVLDFANDVPPFSLRAVTVTGTLTADISPTDTSFAVTRSASSASLGSNMVLTLPGPEYVYITGTSDNNTVSSCIRGYGGSQASGHTGGNTSVLGTDAVHIGGNGLSLIAGWVKDAIAAQGSWT